MSVKTWGCSGQLQLRTYHKMPRVSLTGDRRHPCWSWHCNEPWQGVPCSAPFSDASSAGAAPSGAVLGAAAMKHPQDTTYGDVAATTAGLLPASPEPWPPPLLPGCKMLSQPSQARCRPQGNPPGQPHYLCRRGEGAGRAASMPCCCAAAAGGGRGGARRGAAGGWGQVASWRSAAGEGAAHPHSTMVQR